MFILSFYVPLVICIVRQQLNIRITPLKKYSSFFLFNKLSKINSQYQYLETYNLKKFLLQFVIFFIYGNNFINFIVVVDQISVQKIRRGLSVIFKFINNC